MIKPVSVETGANDNNDKNIITTSSSSVIKPVSVETGANDNNDKNIFSEFENWCDE